MVFTRIVFLFTLDENNFTVLNIFIRAIAQLPGRITNIVPGPDPRYHLFPGADLRDPRHHSSPVPRPFSQLVTGIAWRGIAVSLLELESILIFSPQLSTMSLGKTTFLSLMALFCRLLFRSEMLVGRMGPGVGTFFYRRHFLTSSGFSTFLCLLLLMLLEEDQKQ